MTHTHIMLTEQGFVALENLFEARTLLDGKSNAILFAPEEQEKVRAIVFDRDTEYYPYALPDGVEVQIIEVECESICDRACKEYGCDGHTKFAYLKTKEVKEESQDQIIEDLIATWQATCGAITGDEYSEVKRKFKVTRI